MANRNIFNSIPLRKPKRNYFDLSHDVKLSCNMGDLVPIMCEEAVPGDSFDISNEALVRFAPMLAPVMHRFNVSMHYFFVPNRLLWPSWENFITGNATPVMPYIDMDAMSNPSSPYRAPKLADYFGIPPTLPGSSQPDMRISALPFAAYSLIYNEYYRDQNLIASDWKTLVDGYNPPMGGGAHLYKFRRRAWQHDYFTSALPWAQKGAAVDIPLGDVTLKPWDGTSSVPNNTGRWRQWDSTSQPLGTASQINSGGQPVTAANNVPSVYDPNGTLEVQSTTINDLRRSFRLQEWLEKNARAGTRYVESILAHFGVKSSDARLNRPEYITGSVTPVSISEVLNTTGETDGLPQANMAGHGLSSVRSRGKSYFCEEHGFIIGIMSVLPMTAYQQGISRKFWKCQDRFQFYWPEFANIGEQEVYNGELYAKYDGTNLSTFGYNPRYSEYKYAENRVAGEFRNSLSYWHAGRIFATQPALNADFVNANPTTRIFAVTDEAIDHLYCHILNKVSARRPMPKYGVPSF